MAIGGVYAAPMPAWAAGDLSVAGGVSPTDYEYVGDVLTVKTDTPLTISGATMTDKIVVDAGPAQANVTLNNVSIDVSGTSSACAFAVKSGSLTLTLADGSANMLKSGDFRAGLDNGENLLVVRGGATGAGSLEAVGGQWSAGIGGGVDGMGANITIAGGTVKARGGDRGAGIGGGANGTGAHITIAGGTVEARGGDRSPDIGGGANRPGGAPGLSINNVIDGDAWVEVSYIPEGMTYANGVVFLGDEGVAYGTVSLPFDAQIVSGKTLTVPTGASLSIGAGERLYNNGTLAIDGGSLAGPGALEGPGRYLKYDVTSAMIKVPTGLRYTGLDQTAAALGGVDLADLATPVREKILDKDFTVTYGVKDLWEFALPSGTAIKDARDDYKITCTHVKDPARHASAAFALAKAPLSIVADDKQKTMGQADPVLSATVVGAVGGEAADYALVRDAGEDPGAYAIKVIVGSSPVNANYAIAATDAVLTIKAKAPDPAPDPEEPGSDPAPDPEKPDLDPAADPEEPDSDLDPALDPEPVSTPAPKPLPDGKLASTGDAALSVPVALAGAIALALMGAALLLMRRESVKRRR